MNRTVRLVFQTILCFFSKMPNSSHQVHPERFIFSESILKTTFNASWACFVISGLVRPIISYPIIFTSSLKNITFLKVFSCSPNYNYWLKCSSGIRRQIFSGKQQKNGHQFVFLSRIKQSH